MKYNSKESSAVKEECQEDLAGTAVQKTGWRVPGIKEATRAVEPGVEHGPKRRTLQREAQA